MKPWKLCATKKNSYKIDVRDLIDTHTLKPFITVEKEKGKEKEKEKGISNYNINYDFVNMKPSRTKFECRFKEH
jgi:hypothetical protein